MVRLFKLNTKYILLICFTSNEIYTHCLFNKFICMDECMLHDLFQRDLQINEIASVSKINYTGNIIIFPRQFNIVSGGS